jgi:probable HAF family extracellular repeat protein/predicted outer membrane repeat protein
MNTKFLPVIAVVILLGVCKVQSVEYEVIILDTLGGERSYAYAINDSGQVVGQSSTSDNQTRAFLWDKDNGMRNLGALEIPGNPGQPYYYSCATGINNSGQVVGYSGYYDGPERAFLWENGQMFSLGTLGGRDSHATGINNQGQTVGYSINSNGDRRAFLWHNGIMQDIGTLEGRTTYAYGINDNGQVIGESYTSNGYNAFIWDNGVMTNLGTIDQYGSVAKSINNSGQITGSITPEKSYIRQEAVLWDNNTITTLGYLDANDPTSYGHAINENGQIVGYSLLRIGPSDLGHACLWENGELIDLDIFFPENIYATHAYDINGSGYIVGYAEIIGGNEYRAFLMTPIPEPVTRLVPDEYPTIQSAINDCNDGDVVVVSPGTYTGNGNRDIDFRGKAITVRSIDPNDPNIVAATIIDCNGTETEPHRGFYFHTSEKNNSVVAGFTITNGYGPRDRKYAGQMRSVAGAILCEGSSPTIRCCTISGNSSEMSGGGIYCEHGSPTIASCTIIGNSTTREWARGGGIYCWDSISNISNCIISGNSAGYGGGIHCDGSSLTISRCMITGNLSNYGGGIDCERSNIEITNCTISANSADDGGGGIMCWKSIGTICCSILWRDKTVGYGSEIALTNTPNPSYLTISYSNVQGGQAAAYISPNCTINWGTGNINADPCFVREPNDGGDGWGDDPATPDVNEAANDDYGDLHLRADSPCINAGDPNYVAGPNETDIDGELRVMFERIDMGADEFNPIRLGIVKKTRTGRTQFVYDCNATFTNLWPFAVKNVQLEMIKASDNMDINEPNVSFGDIEFSPRESITSIDTCTFQVDRSKAIEPDKIVWQVKCQRADTGMLLELTINGVSSSGLEGEGKIGFEDLAELAGQWLWVGEAGSIPEDVTGDGIVNLRDFAVLAEHQMEGK